LVPYAQSIWLGFFLAVIIVRKRSGYYIMSEQELNTIYKEFLEFYDNNVPSMEHEPTRFQYYVKLFLYYRRK